MLVYVMVEVTMAGSLPMISVSGSTQRDDLIAMARDLYDLDPPVEWLTFDDRLMARARWLRNFERGRPVHVGTRCTLRLRQMEIADGATVVIEPITEQA